ncbi:MAG TPA: alpha/beta fold hydrolase [Polyangiaceae bacterium]|nr:alpha/beta fold hydrolase [Polyangiaceae bacterium]
MYTETVGSGPALVLAHGFGGSARNFRPQARALGQELTVWTYDARGHARSKLDASQSGSESDDSYDTAALVRDFGEVVTRAGQPVIAGGLSMGAYTALTYTLNARHAVRGLILSAFPAPGADRQRAWALGFARSIREHGLAAAGEEFAWGDRSRFDERSRALIKQGFLEHDPLALAALLEHVLAELPAPDAMATDLAGLRTPTLVVVGAEDEESLRPCERLAELLPNARLSVIPGAGHVLNLSHATEFNAAVRGFIAELPTT